MLVFEKKKNRTEQKFISKFQKAIKPMWIQLFTYIMATIDSVDIHPIRN